MSNEDGHASRCLRTIRICLAPQGLIVNDLKLGQVRGKIALWSGRDADGYFPICAFTDDLYLQAHHIQEATRLQSTGVCSLISSMILQANADSPGVKIHDMTRETPEEKFNRLRDQIQNLYLKAYPNPERKGCPGDRTVENLARRASDFRDDLEADADYQHVIHCSPCCRQFLDFTEELKKLRRYPEPMLRRTQKRLARTLDQLEGVMKSAARAVRRR